MKNQVTTIEQWSTLQKLGVPEKMASLHYAFNDDQPELRLGRPPHSSCIPAYTVADLLEIIPWAIDDIKCFELRKVSDGYIAEYRSWPSVVTEIARSETAIDVLFQVVEHFFVRNNRNQENER